MRKEKKKREIERVCVCEREVGCAVFVLELKILGLHNCMQKCLSNSFSFSLLQHFFINTITKGSVLLVILISQSVAIRGQFNLKDIYLSLSLTFSLITSDSYSAATTVAFLQYLHLLCRSMMLQLLKGTLIHCGDITVHLNQM